MITEIGHFCLILAFICALIQGVVPLIGARRRDPLLMEIGRPAAIMQFFLIFLSFIALSYAFMISDFSVRLVTLNSHSLKPWIYKLTGTWGNHEGSMLLWVLILSLFGAFVVWFGKGLPVDLKARVLGIQGLIGVAFLTFILLTSNPFLRLPQPPFDGAGLNPLLQHPGLALHPPFLYLGYVGLSICFSFAIAALIAGKVDAAWARWVRPWTLAAWVFLTIGIGLGSWWAYYELGWGGFWFWDPVENASFMPWLLATALLHSAIVVEKRESLKAWTILLAILAFGFSMIGAFIVRSGVLESVHAFANDPERGLYLLLICFFLIGGGLTLFSFRSSALTGRGVFGAVSRETGLIANNTLLAVSCFTIFIGTIWPLIAEAFMGQKLTVGPPFFNAVFTPMMMLLAVLLPIGTLAPWKRAKWHAMLRPLLPVALLSLAIALLIYAVSSGETALAPIAIGLGSWLVLGALREIWFRARSDFRRLLRLPRADWGRGLSHAGLGVLMIAISGHLAWAKEDLRAAKIGERFALGKYEIELKDVRRVDGPNFISTKAEIWLWQDEKEIGRLFPEKRFYPTAGRPTTEAGIHSTMMRDIYIALGDPQPGDAWALHSHIKPLSYWLWASMLMMAGGGVLSLMDRRMRLGAGAQRKLPVEQVVAAK